MSTFRFRAKKYVYLHRRATSHIFKSKDSKMFMKISMDLYFCMEKYASLYRQLGFES